MAAKSFGIALASVVAIFLSLIDAAAADAKVCSVNAFTVDTEPVLITVHAETKLLVVNKIQSIKAYDYRTGAEVKAYSPTLDAHSSAIVVSPSGKLVARNEESSSTGTHRVVVSAIDGSHATICIERRDRAYITPLAFTHDEKFLLVTTNDYRSSPRLTLCKVGDGEVDSWKNTTLKERFFEALTPRFHGGPPWSVDDALFSPDDKNILAARNDTTIQIYDRQGNMTSAVGSEFYKRMAGWAMSSIGYAENGTIFRAGSSMIGDGHWVSAIFQEFPEKLYLLFDPQVEPRFKGAMGIRFADTKKGLLAAFSTIWSTEILHVLTKETLGVIPVKTDEGTLAVSEDGKIVAAATKNQIQVWGIGNGCP